MFSKFEYMPPAPLNNFLVNCDVRTEGGVGKGKVFFIVKLLKVWKQGGRKNKAWDKKEDGRNGEEE